MGIDREDRRAVLESADARRFVAEFALAVPGFMRIGEHEMGHNPERNRYFVIRHWVFGDRMQDIKDGQEAAGLLVARTKGIVIGPIDKFKKRVRASIVQDGGDFDQLVFGVPVRDWVGGARG